MKTDLHTIPSSGLRVRDLEALMADTDVQGFPVISNEKASPRTLIGYIGRTELRYVLGTHIRFVLNWNTDIPRRSRFENEGTFITW